MGNIIGIDLGTTFSAVARLDETGRPQIVTNAEGGNITPSVVEFLSETSFGVGKEAKKMIGKTKTIVPLGPNDEAKRHMGSTSKTYKFFNETFTPVDISALILKKIKEDVEAKHGDIDSAVVTVPANFSNSEKEATMEAAQKAGLSVTSVINEPTAAALAYSFLSEKELNGTFVIYDLGGGTFDCTIARVKGQDVEILTSEGVRELGGKDFDNIIVNNVEKQYKDATGKDLIDFSINEAEELKISLSARKTVRTSVTTADGFADITITREDFEEDISGLIVQAEMAIESALSRLDLSAKDIDEIILVGGSTRMPIINKSIKKIFSKEPQLYGNPDESVAIGAALYAAYKSDSVELNPLQQKAVSKMNLQEKSGFHLGTISIGQGGSGKYDEQVSNIISRDENLPCSLTESFYTIADNQTKVECTVTSSKVEESDPKFVDIVWEGNLDLPSGRPAGQEVKVTYAIKEDGRLFCSFLDVDSGKSKEIDLDIDRKVASKSTADIDVFKVE